MSKMKINLDYFFSGCHKMLGLLSLSIYLDIILYFQRAAHFISAVFLLALLFNIKSINVGLTRVFVLMF